MIGATLIVNARTFYRAPYLLGSLFCAGFRLQLSTHRSIGLSVSCPLCECLRAFNMPIFVPFASITYQHLYTNGDHAPH